MGSEELKDLQLQIEILKQKVEGLERIERRRRAFKIIKVLLYVITISAVIIFAYTWYQKINDLISPVTNFIDKFKF